MPPINNNNENMDVSDEIEGVDEFEAAFEAAESEPNPIGRFQALLVDERMDDVAVKIKEQCIYRLAKLYTEERRFDEVTNLIETNGAFFSVIPKARTAKIVRNVLGIVALVPDSNSIQIRLCRDIISWCGIEKRTFLRQRIEGKLAVLLFDENDLSNALKLVTNLLAELRKLDDKQMLTEVHLTESRVYHALQNVPKAKASLTACRTAANAIYVNPLLQAEIDEMSGILHCEENDNITAFSYFFEAFEAFDHAKHDKAAHCFRYMILVKVLSDMSSEVPSLLASKLGVKYSSPSVIAMAEIAAAANKRSLEDFQAVISAHGEHLRSDHLITHQLDELYQKMMEGNLLKIIQPFSVVEIAHVAKLIKLPESLVETKLSKMILDHRFSGILDQGNGHLVIYDEMPQEKSFALAQEIIANVSSVVEVLSDRAKRVLKA